MQSAADSKTRNPQVQRLFDELYERYAPAVHCYCRQFQSQLAAHGQTPEDVSQIVWVKVLAHLEKNGDVGDRFIGWLRHVVKNQVIDICRRRDSAESLAVTNEVVPDQASVNPVRELLDRERRDRLAECLEKLKADHERRFAVAQLKLQVEPVKAICDTLDLPRPRVDKLWFEAKTFLRDCVAQG